jgi:transcriptional regulator with XRE-family HTH domain
MTVADRIKEKRKLLGLTQYELAERLGLKSETSITRIEKSGDNVSLKDVRRIADILGCSAIDLMFPNGVIQTVPELRAEAKRMGYKIIRVNPPRSAKYIKCKDCKYLCGKKTNIGIECMHPTRKFRTQLAHYKPPANKACLQFERKDNANE